MVFENHELHPKIWLIRQGIAWAFGGLSLHAYDKNPGSSPKTHVIRVQRSPQRKRRATNPALFCCATTCKLTDSALIGTTRTRKPLAWAITAGRSENW
jgi:hypothetical protein